MRRAHAERDRDPSPAGGRRAPRPPVQGPPRPFGTMGHVNTAVQPLTDVSTWARGNGLEIVLLITGALLVTRLATWISDTITARIDANVKESDALVRSETAKHRHALTQVITWVVLVFVYVIEAVLILDRLGVPISSLVAPATVAGVALGFGAQRIVQDLLAGFFLITERQYGYGDVVRLAIPGIGAPVQGTVEDVTLRVTQIRTVNGEVVTTPNGQIVQATNLSRDWARAVVDVPVPTTVDVSRVSAILQEVGVQTYADEQLRPLLLDAPSVMGVEDIGVDSLNIRIVARTLPGKQFDVGRRLRQRIAVALRTEGIHVAPTLDTDSTTAQG
jgi:small-conductance mechanosensitive channel